VKIQHTADWPKEFIELRIETAEIQESSGAWFVAYKDTAGACFTVLKRNGRPKGFRSIGRLVDILRFDYGVLQLSVTAEMPRSSFRK
jgi:hypothetical protein